MLSKIISGGQTGSDRAGLEAAEKLGIETGGWVPKGYRTEYGNDITLKSYGLKETATTDYPPRTRMNILSSDGTLIFGKLSGGTRLTHDICVKYAKPLFTVSWPTSIYSQEQCTDVFRQWLRDNKIKTLNVAGNRESKNPGICIACYDFLINALSS